GKTGIAISFALPQDARHVQRIERLMKQSLIRKTIEGLEPTKKQHAHNDAPAHKKKFKNKKAAASTGHSRYEHSKHKKRTPKTAGDSTYTHQNERSNYKKRTSKAADDSIYTQNERSHYKKRTSKTAADSTY